jgi:type IV pilus assembly protein PilB
MEHIRPEQKAPSQSPGPRQLGFTIPDRITHNPEVGVTEVGFLNQALKEAITQGASYIHIEPADEGISVRFRIGGEYQEFVREPRDVAAVMTRLRVLAGLPVVPPLGQEWGAIEFQSDGKTHLFGTQMLPSPTGEKAVLQVLRETHMDSRRLDELGMMDGQLDTLKAALEQRSGLIVLCGPPGSGLETTAYASLLRIDRKARSVATIELVARGHVPGVHQMEAGDVDEKNAMLRAVMRTDTDVVYVRDLTGVESAALALSAASEHHKLVIATLYSSCAAAALMHFVKLGIEPWLVGTGIALIQAQRLLPCLCPECRKIAMVPDTPPEGKPDGKSDGEKEPQPLLSRQANECEKCDGLGVTDGKILVCESMPFSGHMQQWLIEKASESEVQAAAVQQGMTSLRSMALSLAREGLISIDEVYLHTPPE